MIPSKEGRYVTLCSLGQFSKIITLSAKFLWKKFPKFLYQKTIQCTTDFWRKYKYNLTMQIHSTNFDTFLLSFYPSIFLSFYLSIFLLESFYPSILPFFYLSILISFYLLPKWTKNSSLWKALEGKLLIGFPGQVNQNSNSKKTMKINQN